MNISSYTKIDHRSAHLFHFDDQSFLFDRASGALMGLNPTTYNALSRVINNDEPSLVDQEFAKSLQDAGMLCYSPVNHDEQKGLLKALWQHRPRRVQLLMAQGCNLGCRYCYAWRNGSNQKGTLMPFEIAKQAVDHLVRHSGGRTDLQVTFFGGEPLLNLPIIREVVSYCRELEKKSLKRFTFELITNGVLLTPDVVDWIIGEKFLLFVSLDGWKEMHNHNRPSMDGDDVYDLILEHALYANAQYIKHGLTPMKVRANLTKMHNDWKAVGEYLASLGFKVIGIGAIEPLSHGDTSPSAMTEDQMDKFHETVTLTLKSTVESLINKERISYFEQVQIKKALVPIRPRQLKGVTCGVARNTQVVDNKGNIFPCHRYEGMENYIIGDVFTGLDKEKTMAYYRKVNGNATNRCHSCWIRDYCGGGCAWLLSKKDGHLADPTERECDRRRASVERALWIRQKMRAHFPERFNGAGEIDLDSWDWGVANALNEANESLAVTELAGVASTCGSGSGCENCGPSGCAD